MRGKNCDIFNHFRSLLCWSFFSGVASWTKQTPSVYHFQFKLFIKVVIISLSLPNIVTNALFILVLFSFAFFFSFVFQFCFCFNRGYWLYIYVLFRVDCLHLFIYRKAYVLFIVNSLCLFPIFRPILCLYTRICFSNKLNSGRMIISLAPTQSFTPPHSHSHLKSIDISFTMIFGSTRNSINNKKEEYDQVQL